MAILFAPIRNVNPMIARSPGYFFCWAGFSPDQKVGLRPGASYAGASHIP
nr:MAG TPA: hypothetical protein [Caudoviricetes sp.]